MLSEGAQEQILADGQDLLSYSQNVSYHLTDTMKDVRSVVEENHMFIRIASDDFFAISQDVVSKMIAGEYDAGQAYRAFNARLLKEETPDTGDVVLTSETAYSNVFHKNGGNASREYAVEIVTPVLEYSDIPLLQEIVRAVRSADGVTGAQYNCGIHIHVDGAPYTAQSLRNLVNIFASKENFLFDMLQVSPMRETYCQKVDRDFLEMLNKEKPKTIEAIQKLWYRGDMDEVHHHYSSTRYKACNLHSFFANGHWKMRACNSSLHAGVIRSYVTLALAISNAALTKKFCSPHISESDNLRYSARVWLINLGLNGEEFRNCRKHLISHLDGCISWRHPEDAIAQRERLKEERIAAHEHPVSEVLEQCESLPDEVEQAAVDDFEEDYEQEEFEESMDFSISM